MNKEEKQQIKKVLEFLEDLDVTEMNNMFKKQKGVNKAYKILEKILEDNK